MIQPIYSSDTAQIQSRYILDAEDDDEKEEEMKEAAERLGDYSLIRRRTTIGHIGLARAGQLK